MSGTPTSDAQTTDVPTTDALTTDATSTDAPSTDAQASAAPRRLTLCADDFGQSAAINAGILSLLDAGRLQATSVLSDGPAWPQGAQQLKDLLSSSPRADVGLHLNLTHPFAAANEARPLSFWLLASHLRLVSRSQVRDSFLRQLDTFERHFGRLPDYLDGHQHVHAFPVVRDAVMDVIDHGWPASAGKTAARPWLRVPEWLVGSDASLKATVLRASTRGFGALATSRGLRTPPAFGGLYSLRTDDGFAARMQRWLQASLDGTLIMCHPPDRRSCARTVRPDRRCACGGVCVSVRRGIRCRLRA